MRMQVRSLALLSGLRIWHCYEQSGDGSYLALLWLWHRPAAVAPISPLAWELPYATGAAQEKKRKEKKNLIALFISLLVTSNPFGQEARLQISTHTHEK